MRIVAGIYGGRRLQVPKGRDIRPTSDKVRGAMFNTLNSFLGGYVDFDEAHVLDAFCGTGALGLEALSRGAGACVFVDKAKASLDLARENASALGAESVCSFKSSDAAKVHMTRDCAFDLVFLDPPYAKGLIVPALDNLVQQGVLREGAICVLESEKGLVLELPQGFEVLKDKVYGDTGVTYLRYK